VQKGAITIYLQLEDEHLSSLYFKVTQDDDGKVVVEQQNELVGVENLTFGWITDTLPDSGPNIPMTLLVEATDSSANKTVKTVKFVYEPD
jgi:hypothetical protein